MTRSRHATSARGSTLVEVVAALGFVAAAGAVVAAAATTSLRTLHLAQALERMSTIAARELAALQAEGVREVAAEEPLDEPGLGPRATLTATARRRDDDTTELSVTVTPSVPAPALTFTTRMPVTE